MEGLRGASGFVALQMSDEMPGSLEVGDCGEFLLPFLNTVLAKVAEPGIIRFVDRVCRVRFGNADQKNLFGFSGSAAPGRFHLPANLLKIFPVFWAGRHRSTGKILTRPGVFSADVRRTRLREDHCRSLSQPIHCVALVVCPYQESET